MNKLENEKFMEGSEELPPFLQDKLNTTDDSNLFPCIETPRSLEAKRELKLSEYEEQKERAMQKITHFQDNCLDNISEEKSYLENSEEQSLISLSMQKTYKEKELLCSFTDILKSNRNGQVKQTKDSVNINLAGSDFSKKTSNSVKPCFDNTSVNQFNCEKELSHCKEKDVSISKDKLYPKHNKQIVSNNYTNYTKLSNLSFDLFQKKKKDKRKILDKEDNDGFIGDISCLNKFMARKRLINGSKKVLNNLNRDSKAKKPKKALTKIFNNKTYLSKKNSCIKIDRRMSDWSINRFTGPNSITFNNEILAKRKFSLRLFQTSNS